MQNLYSNVAELRSGVLSLALNSVNFAVLPITPAFGGKFYPSAFSQYQRTRIFPFESFIEVSPQLRVPDEGRNEQDPWAAVMLLVSSMTASSHGIKPNGYISGEIPRNT